MMSDRSLVAKENDERKLDPSPSLYRETYKDLSRLTAAYGETIYLRRNKYTVQVLNAYHFDKWEVKTLLKKSNL